MTTIQDCAIYPSLKDDIQSQYSHSHSTNKNTNFRPIYDTPSTEKYLLT